MGQTCCGVERESAYCADCGKELKVEPIRGLRAHVVQVVKRTAGEVVGARKHVADLEAMEKQKENGLDWSRGRLKKLEATADKWKAWLEALDALIEAKKVSDKW